MQGVGRSISETKFRVNAEGKLAAEAVSKMQMPTRGCDRKREGFAKADTARTALTEGMIG